MRDSRKFFLIVIGLCFAGALIGIIAMEVTEHLARLDLPPEMQTPEAIQKNYDGAVCLSCDLNKFAFGFFGFGFGFLFLVFWGIYEVVLGPRTILFSDDTEQ